MAPSKEQRFSKFNEIFSTPSICRNECNLNKQYFIPIQLYQKTLVSKQIEITNTSTKGFQRYSQKKEVTEERKQ